MNVDRGERRGAGDGISRVRAAEAPDLRGVHHFGAAGDGREREAARERLGHRHEVGLETVVLGGEHRPGAAEAGLDLVDDEQDAVLAAESREQCRPIRRGATMNPPSPSHELEDHAGDLLGRDLGLEELLELPRGGGRARRSGRGTRTGRAAGRPPGAKGPKPNL